MKLLIKNNTCIIKYTKRRFRYINLSKNISYKMEKLMHNSDDKNNLVGFLNEVIQINLKDIIFDGIEVFQNIVEYNFYLVNLIGISADKLKYDIFIKKIKKGKIKESLFCICNLFYEKYLTNENTLDKHSKRPKKISIMENKDIKQYDELFVNLFYDDLKKKQNNIVIKFIKISELIEQNNNIWEGWKKYDDLSQNEILIVGIKNKY